MKKFIVLMFLFMPRVVMAQGNDFPTFPSLPPFSPPPLIAPDPSIPLPTLLTPFQKQEAAAAADRYDAIAAGMDNFTAYWCNLNALVCGYMANGSAIMRIYSASMRRMQQDPLDPHFREPVDPVLPSPESLGLRYVSDAPYLNWLIGNAQSTWAWEEMIRVTADRAATCLWLINLPNDDCNWDIFNWQMARLQSGIDNLIYLQNETGNQIAPVLRDTLWGWGLGGEGWLYNDAASTALQAAQGLRGYSKPPEIPNYDQWYYVQ